MAPHDDLTAERAAIALLEQMGLYGHPAASQFIGDILAALKTARQEALREPIQWLKEFIEWNACYEQSGTYQCNQCGRQAIPGQSNHDEDCDIVTARALLDRLASEEA